MMDLTWLIDPELLTVLDFPNELAALQRSDLPAARAIAEDLTQAMLDAAPPTDIRVIERKIPGPDASIPVVIYEPPNDGPLPALLWIHGGGYILGSPRDDALCIPFVEYATCVVVSVDYRLAPEHPFPAGPEDCYAALQWMVDHADKLGIDRNRIAIGGASAGGGMAAGVALMNRDRSGTKLVFQLLLYPMIDDTHDTSSGHAIVHPKVWNRDVSLLGWQMYLGNAHGSVVSPYAAVLRATDVSNLPPTYICVGTLDLFRDENIDYAQRLMAADVPTELAVYPGMTHGAESAMPDAAISQRMRFGYMDALKRALAKQVNG
jgi:acetyl esterase/lipase